MIQIQPSISRVQRSRESARRTYDRLSRWYDLFAGSSEQAANRECLRLLDAEAGESILEIGSGTGESVLFLAQTVGASGHVYGLDLSEGMLATARSKLSRANLLQRVHLDCGDALQLPYAAESMDAVFLAFTLELFDTPEIPVVLAECKRVLKPAGRLGIVSLSKQAKLNWITRAYEWVHEKLPALVDCRPILVLPELQNAGFRLSQTICRSLWGLPVEIAIGEKI